ncbi:phosphomannomutase/phosphoglucomutase [Psychrobacter sp. PL15]|uniref:phosphomannomutase n=1 Tax=unclassified Psychrobacter TaxID=196806 RepID=UPI001AEB6B32|nr:phosphomannomutase [Psychrobacter sp. PL15]MEC5210288.1 phosphomannomutase/phosphoglucomutase [Psychrobacter sp. PL15]
MPSFSAQHSLFRAYDIRGARQHFTSEFVQALGEAFAQLYNSQNQSIKNNSVAQHNEQVHDPKTINENSTNIVVIGYDVRYGSDTIAQWLANTLRQRGLTVIGLGLVTTPMMAFWADQYDGHGIMVTASHSAKDTLGIKWLVGNASSSSEDIQALYQQLQGTNNQKQPPSQKQHHLQSVNHPKKVPHNQNTLLNSNVIANDNGPTTRLPAMQVATTYINAITQVFTRIDQHSNTTTENQCIPLSKLDLTVVIDCMHGATSNIAQRLFERFCRQVIMLNDMPDGNFPTGNPDPTEPNRLAELQQVVIINEADIGLAFDGDGDRLMIVDNSGKVVTPDHLLYLLAQVALTERPQALKESISAPKVLFDIKCSHHLSKLLTQLGAIPVMSRTGSSLMRQQLQAYRNHFVFAGELSGHFIFNDGYFIVYDDAMYAGLRLLHWLVRTATIPNDALPIINDSWGELRPTITPYKLTDITQYLPMMVSTADHYLPLPSTALTECSIVQQLDAFCHYLQQLVEDSSVSDSYGKTPIPADVPSLCTCVDSKLQLSLVQAKQLLPAGTRLTCIDGVRLDFAHGFGVLRQSNTSNSLTVRLAGDSNADLKDVQRRFIALCRPFDKNLAEQIAAIYPE